MNDNRIQTIEPGAFNPLTRWLNVILLRGQNLWWVCWISYSWLVVCSYINAMKTAFTSKQRKPIIDGFLCFHVYVYPRCLKNLVEINEDDCTSLLTPRFREAVKFQVFNQPFVVLLSFKIINFNLSNFYLIFQYHQDWSDEQSIWLRL